MIFEEGKCYKYISGSYLKIVGKANTTVHGECLVGETPDGKLHPVGTKEWNTVGYVEIDESEWMKLFA